MPEENIVDVPAPVIEAESVVETPVVEEPVHLEVTHEEDTPTPVESEEDITLKESGASPSKPEGYIVKDGAVVKDNPEPGINSATLNN